MVSGCVKHDTCYATNKIAQSDPFNAETVDSCIIGVPLPFLGAHRFLQNKQDGPGKPYQSMMMVKKKRESKRKKSTQLGNTKKIIIIKVVGGIERVAASVTSDAS